jgi:hypothetical protein
MNRRWIAACVGAEAIGMAWAQVTLDPVHRPARRVQWKRRPAWPRSLKLETT